MKNRRLFLGLWGVACMLSSQALFAINGHGFNELTGIYQWDSGRHSSVDGPSTNNAEGITRGTLIGNNAASYTNIFDTNHRGLDKDTIVAVQVGFVDIVDSFNSYQCRGGNLSITSIPTAGRTVTIGIWPASVGAKNQKRNNAIYLQDYVIQPEDLFNPLKAPSSADSTSDIGITSNYKSLCPSYYEGCFCFDSEIEPSLFCKATGPECQDCNCVFEGNGSNIRPSVATIYSECTGATGVTGSCDTIHPYNSDINALLNREDHIRRPEAPAQNTGACALAGGVGCTGATDPFDIDGPVDLRRRNPFSEYQTIFTTINLDQAVEVTGEFYVGILVNIPEWPLESPVDDLSMSVIGTSVIDYAEPQPQPNGINISNILRSDNSCCLENNQEIVSPLYNPIANGFLNGGEAFLPGQFAGLEDEVFSIRAIPQNTLWWNQ